MSSREVLQVVIFPTMIFLASCSPSTTTTPIMPTTSTVHIGSTPTSDRSPTKASPRPTNTTTPTVTPTPQPVLQLTYMLQEPNGRVGLYAVTLNCPYENPPCLGEPEVLFAFKSVNDPSFTKHTWSQDGSEVVFSINAVGWGNKIFLADASGNSIDALMDEREFDQAYHPAWSGSGDQFTYYFCGEENDRAFCSIMTMDLDGNHRNPFIVDENMRWQTDPSWSIDGSAIVFSAIRSSDFRWQLFISDAHASQITQVTSGSGNKRNPALSPDNNRIVFIQYRTDWEGVGKLMIIDAQGANESIIRSEWLTDFSGPTWSQVGNWIAYNKMFNLDRWEIFISKPDGTSEIQITDLPDTSKGLPAWRYVH